MSESRQERVARLAKKHGFNDLAEYVIEHPSALDEPQEDGNMRFCHYDCTVEFIKEACNKHRGALINFLEECGDPLLVFIALGHSRNFSGKEKRRLVAVLLKDPTLDNCLGSLSLNSGHFDGRLLTEEECRRCLSVLRANDSNRWYAYVCDKSSPLNNEEKMAVFKELIEESDEELSHHVFSFLMSAAGNPIASLPLELYRDLFVRTVRASKHPLVVISALLGRKNGCVRNQTMRVFLTDALIDLSDKELARLCLEWADPNNEQSWRLEMIISSKTS